MEVLTQAYGHLDAKGKKEAAYTIGSLLEIGIN